jgi:hypothetical protein
MKKLLALSTLGLSLNLLSVRADLIWYEGYNYPDGPIVATGTNVSGTTNWFRHSGTANPSDALVKNRRQEISATGGTLSRQDDVHRDFPALYATNKQILYASFTVNCTNFPNAAGSYFAHFYVSSTTFHSRIHALTGSLPNTWRLGISGVAGTANQVFPVDLATNVDYQVVVQWDPVSLFAATLWVNPLSSSDPSLITSDAVAPPAASTAFGFRQASTFGNFFGAVSNLAVATTFEEAATNVWSTNAVAPVVLYQPKGGTNFPGETVSLSAVAAGQGLANLTYQWLKDGAGVNNPNGNSSILTLSPAATNDSGNYQLVATTPYGLSATSAVAFLWVTNAPIKPIITQQPTNATVFYHQTTTLKVTAIGPPPLAFQWFYTNSPATSPNVSGADTNTLTISDVFTNNGTAGPYFVVIMNPYGNTTSSTVNVTAVGPPAVSLAFLRTLVDPVNYVATNSNLRWQATGIVTTLTNLTTGDTSSYYIQDSTGCGINIFVTRGHDFRPALGDVVNFTGWLSSFASTLELEADTNDLTTSFTVLSNNIAALPAAKVIPFSITNNLAFCETNLEGSIVMLTNVFFGTNAGTAIPTTGNNATFVVVTNANGETFNVGFATVDLDTAGQTLPAFAWSVIGPFTQNLGNGVAPRNQGYQVTVTRFADIVTNPPAAVTLTDSRSGNSTTLNWTAVPYQYSYSVLAATNVAGPYLPVATGLTFTNTAGRYTDANASGDKKFYRVVSP